MGQKLSRTQRKLLSQLRKKHSYESPFLTNDEQIKLLLRELDDLGLIECQWSRDWAKPVVFAWIPCELCVKGIGLGEVTSNDLIPFWHCEACKRYKHDLAAAEALKEFAEIHVLDQDSEHNFGFESRRLEAVETNLLHHWRGKVRQPRAA